MPDPLAPQSLNDIPDKSKRRGVKAQRAAYLYVVEGLSVAQAAKRAGMSEAFLYAVAAKDGWKEWRMNRLAMIERKIDEGGGIEAVWTEGDIQRLGLELNKTCKLAEVLQSQRDTCITKLDATDPRTPKYTTLVSNIEKLTALIHKYTMLDEWLDEARERRRDMSRKGKGKAGDVPAASSTERVALMLPASVGRESGELDGGAG